MEALKTLVDTPWAISRCCILLRLSGARDVPGGAEVGDRPLLFLVTPDIRSSIGHACACPRQGQTACAPSKLKAVLRDCFGFSLPHSRKRPSWYRASADFHKRGSPLCHRRREQDMTQITRHVLLFRMHKDPPALIASTSRTDNLFVAWCPVIVCLVKL